MQAYINFYNALGYILKIGVTFISETTKLRHKKCITSFLRDYFSYSRFRIWPVKLATFVTTYAVKR